MKVTTKITERDKKLLVFLAVVIIVVITAVAGILPAYDRMTELDGEIEAAESMKAGMDQTIASAAQSQAEKEQLTAEFGELGKNYYDLMESQQIDRTLTSKVLGCGVEIQNMVITQQADPAEVVAYGSQEEESSQSTQDNAAAVTERTADNVYAATVAIDISGSKEQVRQVIDMFADDAGMRLLTIEYGNENKSDASEAVKVSITLELYMCTKE